MSNSVARAGARARFYQVPDNRGLGMNWIRLDLRLAIYARDHFDCVWCRQVFPPDPHGYGLTLDHVDGPSNAPDNLVTACNGCNAGRGGAPLGPVSGARSRARSTEPSARKSWRCGAPGAILRSMTAQRPRQYTLARRELEAARIAQEPIRYRDALAAYERAVLAIDSKA